MNIAVAADHGGYELKEKIKARYAANLNITDLGTFSTEAVDYPDMAKKVVEAIRQGKADLGILVCGTGIGISIAANRCKGIRAALVYNKEVAGLARRHNNANVLVFGGRTMNADEVFESIDAFLGESYEGGRHQRRLDKLETME